jgi:hypothetical protein
VAGDDVRNLAGSGGDGGDSEQVIVMRAKLVWRLLSGGLVACWTCAAIAAASWTGVVAAVVFAALVVSPFRGFIRIEDGVLYRRGVLRWYAPLDLTRLTEVRLLRMWQGREPYPNLELLLVDRDNKRQYISLRWWSNWEPLVTLVALAVSEPDADRPDHACGDSPSTRRPVNGSPHTCNRDAVLA